MLDISDSTTNGDGQQLPDVSKRQRRRPRRREERGLPSMKRLRELAATYLKTQRRLWPKLVKTGELPALTKNAIEAYAKQFKKRFLRGNIEAYQPKNCLKLGVAYARYSCDRSNPRSLNQQLVLQLERARKDEVFVPWAYFFADAAVSGLTSFRTGYSMAKQTLQLSNNGITTLYIDEIGRASRDAVEALLLGRLIDSLNLVLIGISDGFDSRSPMAKLILAMFAAVQQWFSEQLSSKVNRGMRDAFYLGTSLRPAPFGYRLVPAVDKAGNPIFGKDGKRSNMLAVNPEEAPYVELAFDLLVNKRWSRADIGRHFNDLGIAEAWDGSRIRDMLKNELYVGIQIEHRSFHFVDPKTGIRKEKMRPRSEWRVRLASHLRIVSWKLWKAARRRLAETAEGFPRKGKKATRNRAELYDTTLVRPYCRKCKTLLAIGSSGNEKYGPSLACLNGRAHKHQCDLFGYKSASIIDRCVLDHVVQKVLTPQRVDYLITKANEFLLDEAAKPKVDLAPIERRLTKMQARRDRLEGVLEKVGSKGLERLARKVKRLNLKIKKSKKTLNDAKQQVITPAPIAIDDVMKLLPQLRELLYADVTAAAPVLRQLTGKVEVWQETEPGAKKPTWMAGFCLNMVPVLARLARSTHSPMAGALEYLTAGGWKMPVEVAIPVRKVPKYEQIAAEAVKLNDQGVSIADLASAYGTSWEYMSEILDFGRTGERPQWKAAAPKGAKKAASPQRKASTRRRYPEIAADVAQLRDEQKLGWAKIKAWLKDHKRISASVSTIRRAYDYFHREKFQAAVKQGRKPSRGWASILGEEKFKKIRQLIQAGLKLDEIAAKAGCSPNTVRREIRRLAATRGTAKSA